MTIKEVAKHAGVSVATVSYVINGTKKITPEKTRRVLAAIEELGYQPNRIAKSLRVQSTSTIGVLVEDIMDFPVTAIINGISEQVEKNGYQIVLSDLRMHESLSNRYEQIKQYKEKINGTVSFLLHGARVDAVIYVGMFDRDITGVIDEIEKPLVVAYSTTADAAACYVTYDGEKVSAEVIRYFLERGHRRIAVITGLAHTSPVKMRMRGVQQAFHDAGTVLDSFFVKNGDWEYESGYRCMMELLGQDPMPTAVFAMNDLMAAGAMDAIHNAGMSVPGDISVIGFDDREVASYLRPKLTTVRIDLKGIGQAAAEMALNRIRGRYEGKRNRILPSRIIPRETVTEIQEKPP